MANCLIKLPQKARKAVMHKLKTACSTRWLSFEATLDGLFVDMTSILQTLREMKDEIIAKGLLAKMHKFKFISTIYILKNVIPTLSTLCRTIQAGTINYATIEPSINTSWILYMTCFNQSPLLSRWKKTSYRVEDYLLLGYILRSIR